MPYDEEVIVYTPFGDPRGGIVLAYPPTGRSCIIVDDTATAEEAEDTIKWAREVLGGR